MTQQEYHTVWSRAFIDAITHGRMVWMIGMRRPSRLIAAMVDPRHFRSV